MGVEFRLDGAAMVRKQLERLPTILFVALGGSAGAVARHLLGEWIATRSPRGFPWGTFAVNVSGCLAAGFVLALLVTPCIVISPTSSKPAWAGGVDGNGYGSPCARLGTNSANGNFSVSNVRRWMKPSRMS